MQFNKSYNLFKHMENQHKSPNVHRCFSGLRSLQRKSLYDHGVAEHRLPDENIPRKVTGNPDQVEATTVAVNNRFRMHCLKLPREEISVIDPFNYLVMHQRGIKDFIDTELQKVPRMKTGLTIAVDLVKPLNNDKVTAFFNSFLGRTANVTDEKYLDHVDQPMSKLNVFASCGSGWVIERLQSVEVKTATCQTLSGSERYFEKPFERQKQEQLLFFILCCSRIICFHRSRLLSEISSRKCEAAENQFMSDADALIQYTAIREKQQCLLMYINWKKGNW